MRVKTEWFDPSLLAGMELVRSRLNEYGDQDHVRWTFRQKSWHGTLYYKVWKPTYIRRNGILLGLESGFYDETTVPALKSILVDESGCRGYVMRRCKSHNQIDPGFFEHIQIRTRETGVFFYDLRPHHIVKRRGRFCLIDLEGIYRLSDLERMTSEHAEFGYEPYREFVESLV